MSKAHCPCETLERLEGASVSAYINAFLNRIEAEVSRFRCKVCGREWEKRAPEGESKRASLIRLN